MPDTAFRSAAHTRRQLGAVELRSLAQAPAMHAGEAERLRQWADRLEAGTLTGGDLRALLSAHAPRDPGAAAVVAELPLAEMALALRVPDPQTARRVRQIAQAVLSDHLNAVDRAVVSVLANAPALAQATGSSLQRFRVRAGAALGVLSVAGISAGLSYVTGHHAPADLAGSAAAGAMLRAALSHQQLLRGRSARR